MNYIFGEVDSPCSRGQCGGAAVDSMELANASLDDALVNLEKKIMVLEEQKRKLITQGGLDDAVKALQVQVDQMNDQKVKALAARDLSKNTVGSSTTTTADKALTDLSLSLAKVADVAKGACKVDRDCSDPDMVCNKGMCGPTTWYQKKYWGLPLWGWILIGLLILVLVGIAGYYAVPYVEAMFNAGTDGGMGTMDTGAAGMDAGVGASPLNDMGSMAGATPGYPGSA